DPSKLLEPFPERCSSLLPFPVALGKSLQYSDAPHPLALLRARRERPRHSRAANERDELAPLHVEHQVSPPGKPAPIPLCQLTPSSACRRAVGASLGQT